MSDDKSQSKFVVGVKAKISIVKWNPTLDKRHAYFLYRQHRSNPNLLIVWDRVVLATTKIPVVVELHVKIVRPHQISKYDCCNSHRRRKSKIFFCFEGQWKQKQIKIKSNVRLSCLENISSIWCDGDILRRWMQPTRLSAYTVESSQVVHGAELSRVEIDVRL